LIDLLHKFHSYNIVLKYSFQYEDAVVYRHITKCGYMESDFFHLEGFPDADASRLPDDLSSINVRR